MRVLTFAMAETLAARTDTVETVRQMFGTDFRQWWTPDDCFLDLMRDKQAIPAMVREIAGDQAADAHITEPAKKAESHHHGLPVRQPHGQGRELDAALHGVPARQLHASGLTRTTRHPPRA